MVWRREPHGLDVRADRHAGPQANAGSGIFHKVGYRKVRAGLPVGPERGIPAAWTRVDLHRAGGSAPSRSTTQSRDLPKGRR
jgi:hypothetical protein